jgi:hypothetical protein
MRYVLTLSLLALIALAVTSAAGEAPPAREKFEFGKPKTHKNLTIILIRGKDRIKAEKFLTLKEALEKGKAKVHETGNVQKLAIENLSQDEVVYVQSGDIVKGGQQDRVIAYDFVVPPKSGKMPISSFCVERGRWNRRGGEDVKKFTSSANQVIGKDLKLAAKFKKDQGQVWAKVTENQNKLVSSLKTNVKDARSASSMQLTLENKKLKASLKEYREAFAKALEGEKDVIGFAFAINGKVNCVDVYASGKLFRKLWPKLLDSASAEAVAEYKKDAKHKAVTDRDVKECMADAERGAARKEENKKVTARVRMLSRHTKEGNYFFETRDEKQKGQWLHRNYLAK